MMVPLQKYTIEYSYTLYYERISNIYEFDNDGLVNSFLVILRLNLRVTLILSKIKMVLGVTMTKIHCQLALANYWLANTDMYLSFMEPRRQAYGSEFVAYRASSLLLLMGKITAEKSKIQLTSWW